MGAWAAKAGYVLDLSQFKELEDEKVTSGTLRVQKQRSQV